MAIWNTNNSVKGLREGFEKKVEELNATITSNLELTFINSRHIKELSSAMKELAKRVLLLEEEKAGLSERLYDLVEKSTEDIIK